MDEDPYLTLDLESVWRNGVSDEVLRRLSTSRRRTSIPRRIAELAHVRLVKKRLRTSLLEEASTPSEEFCRFFLQRAGLSRCARAPSTATTARSSRQLSKRPWCCRPCRSCATIPDGKNTSLNLHQIGQRIVTSEHELTIVSYVRRRLAYLVRDEALFSAIDRIEYKDSVGKLVVYYANERKGRLFDYIEGAEGFDKFIFPSPYGEIVTKSVLDIDEPLSATFAARVRDSAICSPWSAWHGSRDEDIDRRSEKVSRVEPCVSLVQRCVPRDAGAGHRSSAPSRMAG